MTWEKTHTDLINARAKIEKTNDLLQKLRKRLAPFDGKMFNVRIEREIEAEKEFYVTLRKDTLRIYPNCPHTYDLIWINPTSMNVVTEKGRYNHEALSKYIGQEIQINRQKIAKIDSDLLEAEAKLKELFAVREYYISIARSLTGITRKAYRDIKIDEYAIRDNLHWNV